MNTLRFMIVAMTLLTGSFALFGQEFDKRVARLEKEVSISGEQLAVFEAALLLFKKHDLNILGYEANPLEYEVTLYKQGDKHIVIFDDPKRSPLQASGTDNLPAFLVVLDADRKWLEVQFSR